ncbi:MAG: Pr6Pr family membrane protein [Pararhodobacter sp.]|nr:Pr6Pr family membrane protein [Pararhodobacter sp.]
MRNPSWQIRLAWAGAVLGLALLIAQAFYTIPARMAEGGGFWRALVFYFSYFTTWAATLAVLVWFAHASARPALHAIAGPTARTLVAGAMMMLIGGHSLLVAPVPVQGIEWALVLALNYLLPLAFCFWWLFGPHPVPLRWQRLLVMLALPVGYGVWIVSRGLVIDRWPYPFLSLPELGWGGLVFNIVVMTALFAFVYAALIAVSRVMHRSNRHGLMH